MPTSLTIRRFAAVSLLTIGACAPEVLAPPNYTVAVGQDLTVKLSTFGAGALYDSVPSISSPVVRLVSVTLPAGLQTPAGPTQYFQFEALARGRTTITFRKSGTNVVVTDVVEVQ